MREEEGEEEETVAAALLPPKIREPFLRQLDFLLWG
jgi:hypothetical protein